MTIHIFPERLIESDVKSQAEIRLYHAFKEQLSDDFFVFHSVAWLGIRKSMDKPSDGETDFILAHPRMGILLIEVKGGLVGFDPAEGWYSIRKDHSNISIKNPFQQVRSNKYALLRKLDSLPNWHGAIPTLGHAVAFPDGTLDLPELGPESPREIIMFYEDLVNLDNWVRKCLKFWAGEKFIPPGEYGVQTLRDLLARSWLLRTPRLGEEIGPQSTAIERFTEEQFQILETLAGRPRAAIRGCAGSGKTLLAIRKAQKLADEGFQVLLTCYNRNLVEELARSVGKHPRLKVRTFHGLCREYAARTGYDRQDKWDENKVEFFESVMPQALLEAATSGDESYQFDAIIADEGQDFSPSWWAALELLLVDPKSGVFYIFYDDNQLLYPRQLCLPVNELPFALTVNCRNTQPIFRTLTEFYRSDLKLRCKGPQGRDVCINLYLDDPVNLRATLTEVLSRLIYAEAVRPEDVVLLSPGGLDKPPLARLAPPGSFRLVPERSKNSLEIYSTTIRLFKGLESPVVVLLVPPGLKEYNELMYVGISRARNHLEMLIDAGTSESIGLNLQPVETTGIP
jgi:hypothetical protein